MGVVGLENVTGMKWGGKFMIRDQNIFRNHIRVSLKKKVRVNGNVFEESNGS